MRLRLLVPALLAGLLATACASNSRGASPYPAPSDRTPVTRSVAPAPAPTAAPRGRSSNTAYVFIAGWCGYCQKMKRNTLSDASVQGELAALNWKEVNPDQPDGRALAQRYGVSGYPTTVVVNPSGGVVKKIVGYNAPNDYLPQLRQAR